MCVCVREREREREREISAHRCGESRIPNALRETHTLRVEKDKET